MEIKKRDLTEEEADILDEYYTVNLPILGPNEGGVFDRQVGHIISVDDVTANYIKTTTENTSKTPAQIVSDLVKEKLATA